MLEILAGVPTVVYGYFAALTVAPALRNFAVAIGIPNASTESALAAGVVMGVMIIPFVSSRSEEHTSELQSLMRISYAVFCLKKKRHTGQQRQKRTDVHIEERYGSRQHEQTNKNHKHYRNTK